MFPSTKGKTYTCGKCGKVGTDFGEMARELCPADVDASHQIPIFGDRLKHPDLVESKANEELKLCPNCNGLGVLTKTDHGDGLGLISNLCPACDGRGTVVASEHIFDANFDPYPAMNNNTYTSDYPNRQKGFSSNKLGKIKDNLEDWNSDVCPKCLLTFELSNPVIFLLSLKLFPFLYLHHLLIV